PTTEISAGISYGFSANSDTQVAKQSLTANGQAGSAFLSTPPPLLKIVDNNALMAKIPNGFPVKFLVRIKLSPNDYTPLSLNVSTG
ncbi:unnamed protein product, partial [Candidula unifasciata]